MKPEPETPNERKERLAVEAKCTDIGRKLGLAMPPGMGFALLMFDFGDKHGNVAYVSSAERQDMIRLFEELLGRLRRKGDA
jgi:hypothetical protein